MSGKNIEAIYALTPLQEGILFHTLDSSIPGIYFDQYSCDLKGAVDLESLREVWCAVVTRHAALRTLFTWEKREKPLQIVRQTVDLPWQVIDWCAESDAEQQRRIRSFMQRDRDQGFELSKAPLLRLTLIRLSAEHTRMVWSYHHLLLDGWSVRVILDELHYLYAAHVSHTPLHLESAPGFATFVDWQQQRDTSADDAFWRETLGGFSEPTCPEVTVIDADAQITGSGEQGTALYGQMTELSVDDTVFANLGHLARQQRVTLNNVFVAAWSVLLSRYCDARDVVFGTTVAGRPVELAGVEKIAGLFINTLPMRVRIHQDMRVCDLLKSVQTEQAKQRNFEQSALASIQRCSDIPAGTPLFETILVFENFPDFGAAAQSTGAPPLDISDENFAEYSNFPLALLVVPDTHLRLIAVHDGRRFSRAAISRLLQHVVEILQGFISGAEQPLSGVSMLSAAESRRIVEEWNDTRCDTNTAETVVNLFEECVARDPDAVAVTAGGQKVSYSQLNVRANQIAHALQARALVAANAVAIYCERSTDAMAAIFGALKAGIPYVALDTKDPAERLQHILEDLCSASDGLDMPQQPVILTQTHLRGEIPDDAANVILLDRDLDQEACSNPTAPIDADNLAYFIYTSGSTGRPKAVMVSHRSLHNSTLARFDYYELPVSAYALLSSLATDSSIAGIFWTLCSGGNLVIPADRAQLDIGQLAVLIEENNISHTLCVPSLYELMLEHGDPALLCALNVVVVAGEACSRSLVERHFRTLPKTQLFNEYGPSEACVWVSVARLRAEDATVGVTIGRPIANTALYILDSDRRPMPVGVSGELYIGGVNVALGYLGQTEATRKSFLGDPFSENAQNCLYKTGDRARFTSSGDIEFLGRIDHQLKVRGYRVEPGEVEATLAAHPDIDAAVVLIDDAAIVDAELLGLFVKLEESVADKLLTEFEQLEDAEVRNVLMRQASNR